MENAQFKYVLRGRIHNIFEKHNFTGFLKDEVLNRGDNENKDKENFSSFKHIISDKDDINEEEGGHWKVHKQTINNNERRYIGSSERPRFDKFGGYHVAEWGGDNLTEEEKCIFPKKRKYLIVENYTSIVYENCEDKVNIILANKSIQKGRIEIQIKGKECFTIPCTINKNILSCFFPQLERGMYHLFFFFNKEMMYIKLLRPGFELTEDSKCLLFHVIEINDYSYCLDSKKRTNTKYNISIKNNVYTNKELLKLYDKIFKEYNVAATKEKREDTKIAIGNNYKLKNNNDDNFYNFLKCYKDEFIDHSFRAKKNKIDTNNMNFITQLNIEKGIPQSRIPILYKKLLYDNCIYENKMIIMHFHSKIFEFDPFNVLSTHIFTTDELKDGYTIFAFNIIPIIQGENKKRKVKQKKMKDMKMMENYSSHKMDTTKHVEKNISFINMHSTGKKKGYFSTLLMFNSDETNCADVRLWKYINAIKCVKNSTSNNFYIKKNYYENNYENSYEKNIQCPIPNELINNKNVFKKYAEGLKISEEDLFFFFNKEMMYIKLLRPGFELTEDSKCLLFHVIEINDYSYCLDSKKRTNTKYNISIKNNVYTNKELLKLYDKIFKEYNVAATKEKREDTKIAIGNNYKLKNNNDDNFYNFLKCYKDEFIDHSFRAKKNKIDTNNMNFITQLNIEKGIPQSRIPILYKKLLYDNCIYENKMIIMHFHSKIFEFDPFNVLSTHIFTTDELKDGYTIFAFNIIPIIQGENKKRKVKQKKMKDMKMMENYSSHKMDTTKHVEKNISFINMHSTGKKKGYFSTLLMFNSDETNCADVRLWKYINAIKCVKNSTSNNFYIKKNYYENNYENSYEKNIQCPIPNELINNKNVFKKYAEGLKISEEVSIFFENWNDEILPVKKFVNLPEYDIPYIKMNDLSNFIRNTKEDILLLDNNFYENSKGGKNESEKNMTTSGKELCNLQVLKKFTASEKSEHKKEGDKNCANFQNEQNSHSGEQLVRSKSLECLLNNFFSFVFIVEGRIYHSVIPINKLLLLFIVNYWMHFVRTSNE
ncbi:conserved Plasmodium protein, unknown function [Plasmodium malariae]|uniref:Uncharacterized protein n=1 Tax=Plasmodium malariae TaxID=5858 RepID=A0A1C3KAI4_PLAMA|nr:conserved Plasmodium protein, unknown function [Plasmodium malariae]